MTTLHLIVGLPGSGTTAFAQEIERSSNALRLTSDEWITDMLGADPPHDAFDAARAPVETALWALARAALELDIDVVLDFGYFSRAECESFRAHACHIGVACETHFLDGTST